MCRIDKRRNTCHIQVLRQSHGTVRRERARWYSRCGEAREISLQRLCERDVRHRRRDPAVIVKGIRNVLAMEPWRNTENIVVGVVAVCSRKVICVTGKNDFGPEEGGSSVYSCVRGSAVINRRIESLGHIGEDGGGDVGENVADVLFESRFVLGRGGEEEAFVGVMGQHEGQAVVWGN